MKGSLFKLSLNFSAFTGYFSFKGPASAQDLGFFSCSPLCMYYVENCVSGEEFGTFTGRNTTEPILGKIHVHM